MAEQKYKGPFRVVVLYDGAANESIIAAGQDEHGASTVADGVGTSPHVRLVRIEDEPTGHTVRIVYDREGDTANPPPDRGEPYPAA